MDFYNVCLCKRREQRSVFLQRSTYGSLRVVQDFKKLTLDEATTAQRGNSGIAVPFL